MVNIEKEKEYCMSCGEDNPSDREICECGGRNFIFGKNFSLKDKKAVCNCSCDTFELVLSINRSPFHDKTYKCNKCDNTIGVQVYAENEYI